MFIRIEASSAVPVYRQIIDQVKYQIASGVLRPGDRLPSVRELARQLPVNQNTVLKAYDLLARDGLISRRQGDGTFVEDSPPALKKSERVKQVSAILAQAAAQAVHFEIDAEELHELLDHEIKVIRMGGRTRAGGLSEPDQNVSPGEQVDAADV
jgi:GntR family transcriptional regulator